MGGADGPPPLSTIRTRAATQTPVVVGVGGIMRGRQYLHSNGRGHAEGARTAEECIGGASKRIRRRWGNDRVRVGGGVGGEGAEE